MALYRAEIKTFSRAKGQSSVKAGAYRNGQKLADHQTGETANYTKRKGVVCSEIVLPKNCKHLNFTSEQFWNEVEKKETRKNSTVAREFLVSLPHELNKDQRIELAKDLTKALVEKYGFGAEYSLHEPTKKNDEKNHHVHILTSTRKITPAGFSEKVRSLDDRKSGEVQNFRQLAEDKLNQHLEKAGFEIRVSCKSNANQLLEAIEKNDFAKALRVYKTPQQKIGHSSLSPTIFQNNQKQLKLDQQFLQKTAKAAVSQPQEDHSQKLRELLATPKATAVPAEAPTPQPQRQEEPSTSNQLVNMVLSNASAGNSRAFQLVQEEAGLVNQLKSLIGRLNSPGFYRHLGAIINGNDGGVCEQKEIYG